MIASPTPWVEGKNESVFDADGAPVADCFGAAALIVRAVNCHDDLVEALRAMLDIFDRIESLPLEDLQQPSFDEGERVRACARTALAKATGGDA